MLIKTERENLAITPPTMAYDAIRSDACKTGSETSSRSGAWLLNNNCFTQFCVYHRQRPCVCEAACKGDELLLLVYIFCLLPKRILQRCLHAVACEAWCLFFVMGPIFFELHLHTAEGLIWISFCGQLLSWLLVEMSFICKVFSFILKETGFEFCHFCFVPLIRLPRWRKRHTQLWMNWAPKSALSILSV